MIDFYFSIDQENPPTDFEYFERITYKCQYRKDYDLDLINNNLVDIYKKLTADENNCVIHASFNNTDSDFLAFIYKYLQQFKSPKAFGIYYSTIHDYIYRGIKSDQLNSVLESLSKIN